MSYNPEQTRRLRFNIEDTVRRMLAARKLMKIDPAPYIRQWNQQECDDFAADIMKELHDSGVLRA